MIKRIKHITLWGLALLSFGTHGQGQPSSTISLDSCLVWAERNYPLIKQYGLLLRSGEYTLDNAQKGKLPQVAISGSASYQSDVTAFPGGMEGVPELSKDQYQLYAEVVQPLTGISVINHQKRILAAQNSVEQSSLDADLYQIKQRVSDLFFGILLLQGQLEQTKLLRADLDAGLATAEASVTYGTALRTTSAVLRAERLTVDQQLIEQRSSLDAYKQMLASFTGQVLSDRVMLTSTGLVPREDVINRPELRVFDARLTHIGLQRELIDKQNIPTFNVFLQTGIGRPGLNFLSNDLAAYYVGGLRLHWNLSNFYTSKREKELFTINQERILSDRETFLFNTRLTLTGQSAEIDKVTELIAKDREIISLREEIVLIARGQLEHGVITATDYKTLVNDADRARQRLTLHEIERMQLHNRYKLTSGN